MDYREAAQGEKCSYRELTGVLAIAGTVLKPHFLSYYGPVGYTDTVVLIVAAPQWAAVCLC